MLTASTISRGAVVAGIVLWLQACAAPPKMIIESPPPPPPPPSVQPRPVESRPSVAPVAALMRKAQVEQRAGRLAEAGAVVERALRIDPYDPDLWQSLAVIRLAQGDAAQAEVLASKSNSVANNDPDLQTRNWEIIARARRASGNEKGARNADRRARLYDNRL